ncbi:unnamed protein product [Cuscuta epithymum]|uniref:Reverse transcriptase domain-containing protein n=1 Tax=Cuscuta epithymum TaxID=186058 RepID=A0AAV0FXM7_9ASTE|nr:unnamed protein product [Cuscuta epithymum]
MHTRSKKGESLVPLNPEIEKLAKQNRKAFREQKATMDQPSASGTAGTSEVQTTSGNLDFYINTSPQSSQENSPRAYPGYQNLRTPFFPQNQSTPQLNLPPLYQLFQNTSIAPETTFQNQTFGMQGLGQNNPVFQPRQNQPPVTQNPPPTQPQNQPFQPQYHQFHQTQPQPNIIRPQPIRPQPVHQPRYQAPPYHNYVPHDNPLYQGESIAHFLAPEITEYDSIQVPGITAPRYEIKPAVINMVLNNQFGGSPTEDPVAHITKFLRMCQTFKIPGLDDDQVRMLLFPFSLRDDAQRWLDSNPHHHIQTWDQLHKAFIKEYFPTSKAIKLKKQLQEFKQGSLETLAEAWKRFKVLRRACPQGKMTDCEVLSCFYSGLNNEGKMMLDASGGGAFPQLPSEVAEELVEKIVSNNASWYSSRDTPHQKAPGLYEISENSALSARVDALTSLIQKLATTVDDNQKKTELALSVPSVNMVAPVPISPSCSMCGGLHSPHECTMMAHSAAPGVEQVDAMYYQRQGYYNQPYGQQQQGQYGQGNQQQSRNFNQPQVPQGQQQAPQPQQGSFRKETEQRFSSLEDTFKKYMQVTDARMHNMETQLGQIFKAVSERPQGSLPSNTEPNPREHVQAVTLRSGKELEPAAITKKPDKVQVEPAVREEEKEKDEGREVAAAPKQSVPIKNYTPPLPYPARLTRKNDSDQFGKFLHLMKQVQINLPFVDALAQMPKYAKFMKDLLTNKRRLEEASTVTLNEECSAVIRTDLPKKLKDPGSFTIPCFIGDLTFDRALADLGASINLMPLALYEKLALGPLKPTRMCIQLADRSVKYPQGIIEDVLVKVDKFIFPVDFVILDMDQDRGVPLILGRPFLATARALIDVGDGKLVLRVGDESATFDMSKIMKRPCQDSGECFYMDVVDSLVEDCIPNMLSDEAFFDLLLDDSLSAEDLELLPSFDCLMLDGEEDSSDASNVKGKEDDLDKVEKEDCQTDSSIVTPSPLNLKPLPSHLEYAFLDNSSDLPVILASGLEPSQKSACLDLLCEQREALARKLSDMKGISPVFCTHKILMEDNAKPVVQPQRRLNPNMQEVVREEVIRLLDVGIIYPISDSPWVSPTQMVPKKGGMTVVRNEKDELIATRTVTGWRVCIDYRRLNAATRKDHFPLPFIDQILERLAGHKFYCFLDGMSGYFQIPIAPEDQDKTTFTCPFGTFGLCNAPATFMRCMLAIFGDFIGKFMEVFMDDFSVYGDTFDECLENLKKVLVRCREVNLVLNWEKCHFMVSEGVVLGHKISSRGIEVDPAKVDVISKLPPPTSVHAIRSFLGHAGFYLPLLTGLCLLRLCVMLVILQ